MIFPLLLFVGWALLSFGVPVFFPMPLGAHLGFVSNLLVWTGVVGAVRMTKGEYETLKQVLKKLEAAGR